MLYRQDDAAAYQRVPQLGPSLQQLANTAEKVLWSLRITSCSDTLRQACTGELDCTAVDLGLEGLPLVQRGQLALQLLIS